MKKLFLMLMAVGLVTTCVAKEEDRFAQYKPNIYRDQVNQMLLDWAAEHKDAGIQPRDAVIAAFEEMARDEQHKQSLFQSLDIPDVALINEVYLASPEKTPMLYSKINEMSERFGVTVSALLIADIGRIQVYSLPHNSEEGVIIVPFGALANKQWGTKEFEGSLAFAFTRIKDNYTSSFKTMSTIMNMLRLTVFGAAIGFAEHRGKKNDDPIGTYVGRMGAYGVLALLATWPIDVLVRVLHSRSAINRGDRMVGAAGYGEEFSSALAVLDDPAAGVAKESWNSIK